MASWEQGDSAHIDVRGLLPPQPMIAILSLLESDKVINRLVVYIDREPIHLYTELEERGWQYKTSRSDDHYQVEITKRLNVD